jgi:hypothetical protein
MQTHIQLWVGLELTIPVFKRAQTVHALDRGGLCDLFTLYIGVIIDNNLSITPDGATQTYNLKRVMFRIYAY